MLILPDSICFGINYGKFSKNPGFTIVNFSRQSIAGKGMYSGTFQSLPVTHAESRQVLIMKSMEKKKVLDLRPGPL